MHNQESILENETHKLLWDFEKQTYRLISAGPQDLLIGNKKKKEPAELWNLNCGIERTRKER